MPEPTDEDIEAGAIALQQRYPSSYGGSYAAPRETARVVLWAAWENRSDG